MPSIELREVRESDLPALFDHQRQPEGVQMAAFPSRDWNAFLTHWNQRVLPDPNNQTRTIVVGEHVAGYVSSWLNGERRCVGYWLDKAFWGRGVATEALRDFVQRVSVSRPLFAFVITTNLGSIRVLEKCGFVRVDLEAGPDGLVEALMRLDRQDSGLHSP